MARRPRRLQRPYKGLCSRNPAVCTRPVSDIRGSMWLFSPGKHACKGDPAPCRAPACALGPCHLSAVMLSLANRAKSSPLGSPCSFKDEYLTTVEMIFLFKKNIFKNFFPGYSASETQPIADLQPEGCFCLLFLLLGGYFPVPF